MKTNSDRFLERELVLVTNKDGDAGLEEGHPIFFLEDHQECKLFEEPTYFLHKNYVSNGSTESAHTWAGAAQALKVWFQYLQATHTHWKEASSNNRIDFRDAYKNAISPRTGEEYKSDTIAMRMTIVREFYKFVRKEFGYHGDIGLDEFGGDGKDTDRPKCRPNVAVRPLTIKDLRTLLNYVGPQASHERTDSKHCRNRLIFDLGWAVGLRVSEVINLTTLQFLSLIPDMDNPTAEQAIIIRRKGGKRCVVAIPDWLVLDVIAYIEGERADALLAGQINARHRSNRLFVCQKGTRRQGQPLSRNAIQKMIEEACFAVGLVEEYEYTNVETGEKFVRKRAKYCMHDLRHTFAVLTYHNEREAGNAEPWKKIQAQLGHAHMQTTINNYLKHVELFNRTPALKSVRARLGL